MRSVSERSLVKEACDVCNTWIARVVRVSPVLHGHDFWRREGGRLVATPLFVALVVIETTDIVFALDSIPAVLAVTRNPLIVYSSNVMAMLGLRSLYFVLSDAVSGLRYLRQWPCGASSCLPPRRCWLANGCMLVPAFRWLSSAPCFSRRLPRPCGRRALQSQRDDSSLVAHHAFPMVTGTQCEARTDKTASFVQEAFAVSS